VPAILAIGIAMLGLVLIGLSGPMGRGEIEPNRTVGLRTADTLADPAVWYAANAASGRDLFRFGATLLAAAVLLSWVLGRAAVAALTVPVVAGLLALGVVGSLRAARLRAAASQPSARPSTPPGG
jgi:VIT1/CCC1 family predicted Fe2+/Mn2+ transporter